MKRKHATRWLLLPLVTALLSSCQGSPFSDSDFTAKIFPNGIWDLVVQLLAFIVLLLVVFFVGYKPVKKMLAKRRDGVNQMIEDARKDKATAHAAALKADQTIEDGKTEANRILAEARKQAEAEREQIVAKAEEEAEAKRRRADEEIAQAKEASKEEVRQQIIDVALLAAGQVLGREVSDEDNKRLVNDFIADMGEQKEDR